MAPMGKSCKVAGAREGVSKSLLWGKDEWGAQATVVSKAVSAWSCMETEVLGSFVPKQIVRTRGT